MTLAQSPRQQSAGKAAAGYDDIVLDGPVHNLELVDCQP